MWLTDINNNMVSSTLIGQAINIPTRYNHYITMMKLLIDIILKLGICTHLLQV